MKIADARRADITAHAVAARKAVKRKAFPNGANDEPIRSGDPAAVEKIKAKIEALALSIDEADAANAIIRRLEKHGATDAARGFATSGSRAEIRRLHARLKALAKMHERDRKPHGRG